MAKRITLINTVKQTLMKVPRELAHQYLKDGFMPTTKGKLKCFLNREHKLQRNAKVIQKIDFNDKKCKSKVGKDDFNGRTYVAVYEKHKDIYRVVKDEKGHIVIDPKTGKPEIRVTNEPMYSLRIATYPNM